MKAADLFQTEDCGFQPFVDIDEVEHADMRVHAAGLLIDTDVVF